MILSKEHKSILEVLISCGSWAEWKCCPCHCSCAFSTYTARVIATFLLCMPASAERIPGGRMAREKSWRSASVVWLHILVFLFREDRTAWLCCVLWFSLFHFPFSTGFCVPSMFWGRGPLQKKKSVIDQAKCFIRQKTDCMVRDYIGVCVAFSFSCFVEISYFKHLIHQCSKCAKSIYYDECQ